MELKPGIGIGNIKFGILEDEVVKLLGKPDRRFIPETDEPQVWLEWHPHKLRLHFYDEEQDRLAYIETANPALTYNNKTIIGRTFKDVSLLFSDIAQEWDFDEYDNFSTYSEYNYWITLYIEYGVVTQVQIGVPLLDEENYDWPE